MIDTYDFPDPEHASKGIANFKTAFEENNDYREYLGFSQFIQGAFIGKDGYVIDTGNFQIVNYKLMYLIAEKINKHPHLWKWFFEVA